jgi:hypothetical protein
MRRAVAIDGFRWVHDDDREVEFWASLYQHGESDETGTFPLVERVPTQEGGFREESFLEFMIRMDEGLIYSLTTGDVGSLPPVLSEKLSAYSPDQRTAVLDVSRVRRARAYEISFRKNALVTDLEGLSCDISWMHRSPTDVDFSYVVQQALSRFQRAGEPLPSLLVKLLTLISAKPLGRKKF